MKTKNIDNSDAIVGHCLTYNGKPTSKKELLEIGFTEEEIQRALNNRPKYHANYSYLQDGLVLQYFNSGWHSINVIVKSNERFVWVKRWEDYKDETKKATRILKKNVIKEGYSIEYCGYPSEASKYIGKIIEL